VTEYTPTDSIKFIASEGMAHLDYVIDQLAQLASFNEMNPERSEELCSMLEMVQGAIREAADAHSDGRNSYSNGRPVQTRLEMEHGNIYVHSWHPDRTDRRNQPHQIGPYKCSSGTYRTILINGPGFIDVVHEPRPALRLVEDPDR
jgi:hypothetical protein